MAWVNKANGGLTQAELENNANIVINYYRSRNIEDRTIAAILGNMQAESSISPTRIEAGGRWRIWFSSMDTTKCFNKSL